MNTVDKSVGKQIFPWAPGFLYTGGIITVPLYRPVRRINEFVYVNGLKQCKAYSKGYVSVGHYGYFCYLWKCDLVHLFWRADWLHVSKP